MPLALVVVFGVVLWLAGGASRPDAVGQVLVRGAAWAVLILMALVGGRPRFGEVKPVALVLFAALLLVCVQLIPLPPGIWQALPGRAIFADAARLSGQVQPWRPLSLVPGATINAAFSLVVPLAMLVLMTGLSTSDRQRLPGMLLCLIVFSALVGFLQFTGAGFDNPLVNEASGEVSGLFANRNHFALLMAMGCVLAPAWAFGRRHSARWRPPVALGMLLFFALMILASGSRAGLLLGALALAAGLASAWSGIRRELGRYPRWVSFALITGAVAVITISVLTSVAAGRAVSIERALTLDPGQDMRTRGLPTVLAMIGEYFPIGSGVGGFDPVFRLHEPFSLLKPTYFNHAHNDFAEIALDAGLPGLLLLFAALVWWGRASLQAWRSRSAEGVSARLGSALLMLTLVASMFDYPARTPMVMVIVVVAGCWLSDRNIRAHPSALRRRDQHL